MHTLKTCTLLKLARSHLHNSAPTLATIAHGTARSHCALEQLGQFAAAAAAIIYNKRRLCAQRRANRSSCVPARRAMETSEPRRDNMAAAAVGEDDDDKIWMIIVCVCVCERRQLVNNKLAALSSLFVVTNLVSLCVALLSI